MSLFHSTIKSSDLVEGISKNKQQFKFYSDLAIQGTFELNSYNNSTKFITFQNCTFNSFCNISGHLNCGIKFIDCSFDKSLFFKHILIDDFNIDGAPLYDSIHISHCTIKGDLTFFSENSILKNIKIECSTIVGLTLAGLYSSEGGIKFLNNKVEKSSYIDNCKLLKNIHFANSEFLGDVSMSDNTCSSIIIRETTFNAAFAQFENILEQNISLINSVFKGNTLINACCIKQLLSLNNSTFHNQFSICFYNPNYKTIKIGEIKNIELTSCSFLNGVLFSGGSKGSLFSDIKFIHIIASKKLTGEIVFDHLNINLLRIEGSNFDASFFFKRCLFTHIQFSRFTNFGSLHLIGSEALPNQNTETIFKIIDSNIGKTNFSNFSFAKFKKIQIENSDLTQITASNVTWFNQKQISSPKIFYSNKLIVRLKSCVKNSVKNYEENDKLVKEFRQMRELFRQLKYAMDQQGNRIQALVFKQYEMSFFRKELILTKKLWNFDRLILWLSCSNNHGQNWIKPLLILTLVGTPLFSLLLIIAFNSGFSHFADVVFEYKRVYPNLLNPVFTLKDIFGEQVFSGWLVSIAVLYRILYAYLVFQVVSAFRKYIK